MQQLTWTDFIGKIHFSSQLSRERSLDLTSEKLSACFKEPEVRLVLSTASPMLSGKDPEALCWPRGNRFKKKKEVYWMAWEFFKHPNEQVSCTTFGPKGPLSGQINFNICLCSRMDAGTRGVRNILRSRQENVWILAGLQINKSGGMRGKGWLFSWYKIATVWCHI